MGLLWSNKCRNNNSPLNKSHQSEKYLFILFNGNF